MQGHKQPEEAKDAVEGQKATLTKTAPWREGVEDVTVHTTLSTVRKKYGELHEKTKAGDREAALELVKNIVKPEKVKALAEQHPNARVAFVHAEEATGKNAIPALYARQFEKQGLQLDENIIQVNKPAHTGSDRVGRFIRRARFDGEVESGAEYIIVGDHVTMGGTLRDLKDYIESKGGKVVAVSTLTASAGGTKLRPTEEQIKQLNEKGITNEQLRELGIADNIDGLTRREAAEILVLADKGRDRGFARGQEARPGQVQGILGRVLEEEQLASDSASEPSIIALPRIDDNGLNVNTPIGIKLSRLKKEAGEVGLVGYTDSETGDYIFLGNDAELIDHSINLKAKVTGMQDGMSMLRIPADSFGIVTPSMVRKGYKFAITDDKVDEVDRLMAETQRRTDIVDKKHRQLNTFIDEVRKNYPTGYFETKFERPVGLEEFAVAVVPEATSPEVVEALKNAGLDVRTYNATGSEEQQRESRRIAVMDAVGMRNDILFHIEDDAEQEKMYRHITPAEDEANKKYNRQLEEYAQGKMSSGIMFELGEPSPILRICGITGKTIKMRQSVLNEHQKKHELTFDDLKNIPSALYHPIMVYQWGDKARSHVIITELPTHDGLRVTVTIRVNNTGHVLDVEKITSVHGKDLEHLVKEINTEKSDFGKDNLKYVDKKKALSWLTVGPPKGPRITSEGLNSAAKIINDFDSTKYFEEKISGLFPEYVSAASDASELIGGEKVRFEVVAPEEGTLGWYDPNDNSVHGVIPNHSNAEEVKRTVFHEKLGHEGLVSLLGSQEEVNKFGQYIFKSASKELRRKMLGKADDEGYGWDDPLRISKAAQEVFADIAADGPKTAEEFSLWTKVKHYLIKGVLIS